MRSTRPSSSTLLQRVRNHRETARGRRQLALALRGDHGYGVQSDVLAALARKD